jgi:hypothetical protein
MDKRVAIVVLTWQRISSLKHTLNQLNLQTNKSFDVYISNANTNPDKVATIKKYINHFTRLNIVLLNDTNEHYTFRRFFVARNLAKRGYEVILFIDDDVTISTTHVQDCLNQYEPRTYKSGYAWSFNNGGKTYYKNREKRLDNEKVIHYCGTGIAMVDSSIFLEDGLFDYPEGALKIEDLWLSFYAQHVLGWRLMYIKTGSVINGKDQFALFREVQRDSINKDVFLKTLLELGWDLGPQDI